MANSDILKGQWKQMRGRIKQQWGKLTDDELDRMEGNWDELVGLVQERYGEERAKVEAEMNRLLDETKQQLRS